MPLSSNLFAPLIQAITAGEGKLAFGLGLCLAAGFDFGPALALVAGLGLSGTAGPVGRPKSLQTFFANCSGIAPFLNEEINSGQCFHGKGPVPDQYSPVGVI